MNCVGAWTSAAGSDRISCVNVVGCEPQRTHLCNRITVDLFRDQRIGATEELRNLIRFGKDSNRSHFVDSFFTAIAHVEIDGYDFRRDDILRWQFRGSPLDLGTGFARQSTIGDLPRVRQRIVFRVKDSGSKLDGFTVFNFSRDSESCYFRWVIGEFFILCTAS